MQEKFNFDAEPQDAHSTDPRFVFRYPVSGNREAGDFELSFRPLEQSPPFLLPRDERRVLSLFDRTFTLLENYYRDPLSVAAASRTMLLPHQVAAAERVLSGARPRFLIADEVGLGKTIEAGLIIKELKLKHAYKKILICVPAPLAYQWQQELRAKFAEDFVILTGDDLRNTRRAESESQMIISLDLAKDERYREMFCAQKYDLIVFDEAHRLRRDSNHVTRAYQFAMDLSERTTGLLLLSATPFRGKIEEIYYLIQLIDPDILGPFQTFLSQFHSDASMLQNRLSPVVIRRRKVDVGGFTKRFAKTVKIDLSKDEMNFYEQTNEYVKNEFNRAVARGESMKTFVMIVFQKLLDSSPFALLRALDNRRQRLEAMYFRISAEAEESEDVAEQIREWQSEEENEDLAGLINPMEIRAEIQHLQHLITLGSKLGEDSKLKQLFKSLATMQKAGHKKFVIFTQFKSTLEYLAEQLKPKFKVAAFHGGLNFLQKEEQIAAFFRDVEILLCTEAGGEGRNLQISSCLINYDLPWSPLKLEQRIGRIHRFGQKFDVHVVNFACRDTVAERVLEVLEEKIKLFENALGPSDTLLGAFESEFNFGRSLMQFLGKKKSRAEYHEELEKSQLLARENLRHIEKLITPELMDFNLSAFTNGEALKEQIEKSGQALKSVLVDYFHLSGTRFSGKGNQLNIWTSDGAEIAGTFDHDAANLQNQLEYFAMGHRVIDGYLKDIFKLSDESKVVKISGSRSGVVFYIQMSIELDKKYQRLYQLSIDNETQSGIDSNELRALMQGEVTTHEIDGNYLQSLLQQLMHVHGERLATDVRTILQKVRPSENYWRGRITDSAQARKSQLDEKLEIQKGKMRWYGESHWAPAVTKTINDRKRNEQRTYERLAKLEARNRAQVQLTIKKICLLTRSH